MRTDWDNVAGWYDSYLKGDDTYQAQVIAPNLLRLLDITKGLRVLDVACGQGYFAKLCAAQGASVVGIDQSTVLIEKAQKAASEYERYMLADAQHIETLDIKTFDRAFSVLALENIKDVQAVLGGIHTVLKKNGRAVFVLLHPAFRIPQHSDWGYDTKKELQYRKTERYLSEISIAIELNPFHNGGKKEITHTFHRSLQWYVKAFRKAGFVVTNMEEWISHKKSAPGPRQKAEDTARKEIPMFLAIEVQKS